jgi:hypothetical protein
MPIDDTSMQSAMQMYTVTPAAKSVETPTKMPAETLSNNEFITISTRGIYDGVKDLWHESFNYPFFEGGTNANNVSELNSEMIQLIEDSRIPDEIKNRSIDEVSDEVDADSDIYYKVLYDGSDYKAIGLYSYRFWGGTHGNSTRTYLVFDAKTGEKYKIDYFVNDIPDYKNRINDYLINYYKRVIQERNSTDIDLSGVPLNFDGTENYYYDKYNDKLVIEYGEYSLSDYATHFETIVVRLGFIRDDATVAQKILGEWILRNTTNKFGEENDYGSYLWESGASSIFIRFDDDGNFYKKYYTSVKYTYTDVDPSVWKCEGTYSISDNVITLVLNTAENTEPNLFWRNGDIEVAYFDLETETIHYRTNWSATNNETVYCNFRSDFYQV